MVLPLGVMVQNSVRALAPGALAHAGQQRVQGRNSLANRVGRRAAGLERRALFDDQRLPYKDKITKAVQGFVDSYNSTLAFITGKLKEARVPNATSDSDAMRGSVSMRLVNSPSRSIVSSAGSPRTTIVRPRRDLIVSALTAPRRCGRGPG